MSEADSKNRKAAGECLDHIIADPRLVGCARAGRDANPLRRHLFNLTDRDAIIAPDHGILTKLAEILDEVVGKGVVIINDQNHEFKGFGMVAVASSIARMTPLALLTVSSNSASGEESATIPAPAWT